GLKYADNQTCDSQDNLRCCVHRLTFPFFDDIDFFCSSSVGQAVCLFRRVSPVPTPGRVPNPA
ncbi:MAG: hypothetical protein WC343_14615, partial [Bacilli bacterium]